MSEAEIMGGISNIRIGDVQRGLNQTPSDLVPVPQTSEAYVIDESVERGG